jgi:hypothetical protein
MKGGLPTAVVTLKAAMRKAPEAEPLRLKLADEAAE